MAKRMSNDNSIADVLKVILQENRLQSGIDQISVSDVWNSVLGNGVKSYTKSVVLKGSTLYVELTSSVLREELSMGKQKILRIINEEFRRELVTDIKFR